MMPLYSLVVFSVAMSMSCVVAQTVYCPGASDLVATWGTPTISDNGWNIVGGGGVATKAAFNLLGGYVAFDLDFTNVGVGVNANVYAISPTGINPTIGYTPSLYCDGQKTGSAFCIEEDFIESNGNCGGQTTLHTTPGPGANNCTAWGCANSYQYNGAPAFHMQVNFAANGTWTSIHNGVLINPSNLSPVPHDYDWATIVQYFSTVGAVITSTQWTGWVPITTPCGGSSGGNLTGANFWVKNLVVSGTVVQGPTPKLCSGVPTTTPSPASTAAGGSTVPTSPTTAKHSPATVAAFPNVLVIVMLSIFAVVFA